MWMMSKRQLVEAISNIMRRWSKNFSPKFSLVINFANHMGVVLSNDLEIIRYDLVSGSSCKQQAV